jgi:digeranylgeranylglycerophospholipid reductase
MSQMLQADVVIVGAGTAGSYFAWQVAKAGFKVLMIESRKLDQMGANIEIFHMDKRSFTEFGIPEPEPPELIHLETTGYMWSPDRKVSDQIHYPFFVMNMPAFYRRIQSYARQSGVEILEETQVTGILIENGSLTGVTGQRNGEEFSAMGRIIIDASGMPGAVRRLLPPDFGIETAAVDPARIFSCCLEIRSDTGPGSLTGSNSFMFHKGFWNRSYGSDVIIGMSQPGGFDYTWQKHKEFREEYFGDPGRVVARRQGLVPFRRSLLSCVGNGFMVIGDAAFQNKPFSGEGVTSGFTASKIAAETAIQALRKGDTSAGALWDYNIRYFRGQGAKFAAAFAQLPAAAELTRKDVNYLFRRGVIFSGKDFEELNENYEIRMDAAKLLRTVWTMIWGALSGQFNFSSLKKLVQVTLQAGNLKKHFLNYPATPMAYPTWKLKALQLWGEEAHQ